MARNKKSSAFFQRLFSARIEDPMACNLLCLVITLCYTGVFCDSISQRPPDLEALAVQKYIDAFFPTIVTFVVCIIFQNISAKKENTKFSLTAWTIAVIIPYSGIMLYRGAATGRLHFIIICISALILIILAFLAINQTTDADNNEPSTNVVAAPVPKKNVSKERKG